MAVPATLLAVGAATPSTSEPFRLAASGGPASTKAGAHSDVRLQLRFPGTGQGLRHLRLRLPQGLVGNPNATPRCAVKAFEADRCTHAEQVGEISSRVDVSLLGRLTVPGRIYNLVPPTGEPARLGIVLQPPVGPTIRVQSPIVLRSDYGIDSLTSGDLPRSAKVGVDLPIAVRSMALTLYGQAGDGTPFMTNPTSCGPTAIEVEAASWSPRPTWQRATVPFRVTDCDRVPFAPKLAVGPGRQRADRPTAMAVTLQLPRAISESTVRSVAVALPAGTALSPGVGARGLRACTDAQFAAASRRAPACPSRSRLGDVELSTPLLGTLRGGVYLGTPAPGRPLRLLLHAAKGTVATKLVGRAETDPRTGQLTTRFAGLPQIPFTSFTLAFRGGPDAALTAPPVCGTHEVTAQLEPYARPGTHAAASATFATTDCGAARFAPSLTADVAPTRAAADTHMTMTVAQGEDEPAIDHMRFALPTGLLGRIGDVPACPVGRARTGDCPGSTRVGTVTATAGTGAQPARLPGPIYLTGPVGTGSRDVGGLAVVVPAKVGPIDLGDVVVIARIEVRPDLGIDVVAPSLPRIVGGVPLAIRSLALAFDREGFLFNASSCEPKTIRATFTARGGGTATATAPYQATDCGRATFAPTVGVTPARQPAGQPTPLTVAIGFPEADSGRAESTLRSAEVVLPEGTGLSPGVGAHGLDACSDADFDASSTRRPRCPARSRIGSVSLVTPLLGELTGDVYLGTPTADEPLRLLTFAAKGDILVKLVGRSSPDPSTGRLTTRFADLPEVPFTAFRLSFRGGDDAVLTAPRECGRHTAIARLEPHSAPGTTASATTTLATVDCPRRAFAPSLAARVTSTAAAGDTAMTMTVARRDDEPLLDGLRVSLPPGLLGRLADVPACGPDAARGGDCPESTRVGTVTAVAGSGRTPARLSGPIFLTEGDDGALGGLAVVVAAKVGPIDLGKVVVLTRLVARDDVGIDVVADALPRVVKGVPLALRSMTLDLDRDGFLVNGAACEPQRITATFTGRGGATARRSTPYRTTGCDRLPFTPTLAATVGGTVEAPSLTTTIALPPGQATLAGTTLTLPRELEPSPTGVMRGCPLETYEAGRCGPEATIGSATAVSPLVPTPLTGPVRLVTVPGRVLPSLAVELDGVLRVRLRIDTDSDGGRLRAAVTGIPDVPLSTFRLDLDAGGLLWSERSLLCAGAPAVDATFTAHNGATATASALATTEGLCGARP